MHQSSKHRGSPTCSTLRGQNTDVRTTTPRYAPAQMQYLSSRTRARAPCPRIARNAALSRVATVAKNMTMNSRSNSVTVLYSTGKSFIVWSISGAKRNRKLLLKRFVMVLSIDTHVRPEFHEPKGQTLERNRSSRPAQFAKLA